MALDHIKSYSPHHRDAALVRCSRPINLTIATPHHGIVANDARNACAALLWRRVQTRPRLVQPTSAQFTEVE
jgi:hypothetical protein